MTTTLRHIVVIAATLLICHTRAHGDNDASGVSSRQLTLLPESSAYPYPDFLQLDATESSTVETGAKCSVYNRGYGRRRGRCKDTSACDGDSVSGKCRGPSNIQCCVEPILCRGSTGRPGFCQKTSDCTAQGEGYPQTSRSGATGCGRLSSSITCCVQRTGYVVPNMKLIAQDKTCLLYTSPSPRDRG